MRRTRPCVVVADHSTDADVIKRAAELAARGFAVAATDFTSALAAGDLLARIVDGLAAVEACRPGAEDTLEVARVDLHGVAALRLVDVLRRVVPG
ncbi:hypothetical protein [Micromonospora sp. CB01531]|uniref:hypothetical protein n=1 Tax=Micromonospora sp. CB01531 TaxID=1718947 RepID=UPI000961D9DF|nr:hypothetical protein [Micromonospora sp. CB01531]OKI53802.1 hypothetical protein A6A27_32340 [Micromonospora sp. CB01531]